MAKKELHAEYFDGTTFGMDIETESVAYKNFKKHITCETMINFRNDEIPQTFCVPYVWLGAIMREAHWLVTQRREIHKFKIDKLKNDEWIYVKYKDGQLDLNKRF